MAQTPQQRRANNTFAKAEERKRGKPQGEVQRKEKPTKAPISKTWVCECLPLLSISFSLFFSSVSPFRCGVVGLGKG
ncbi:hypothetical protein BTJ68_11491 [Hortaea werneckii EXF-2000]|uniref:Stress-associated endoplasmic reticulum protein n=2 Tax=Hortaea werneckii TaxID=91943 RepID=A0A3M7I392_HORWE|nr:hypothetical protein BTJ68_11491 [Hortaea werneckii EXF-2000]RMZ19792.1 hypothetical protein D0859_16210 [Hortaea werneckii]